MRALGFTIGVLALAACYGNHPSDGEDDGGGMVDDGAVARDGGPSVRRDGGGPPASDGAVARRDGGAPLDLVDECVAACDHLRSCDPSEDRAGCVSDCLSLADFSPSPECTAVYADLFACVAGLDCTELVDRDLSDTECERVVARIETSCGAPPMRGGGG